MTDLPDHKPSDARQMSATCPVCGGAHGIAIDAALEVPVLMNRVYGSREEARTAPRGTLALARCTDCGFVWNSRFDPERIVYDQNYENDQTHSRAFIDHLTERARDVVASVPGDGPIDALEVGCGQGRFMGELATVGGGRIRSLEGFDPAWRGEDGTGPNGARIHRVYFHAGTAGRLSHAPNVVVSRHTIEHVPDPVAFLRAIRDALGEGARTSVFIETPCVDWILQNEALQDFCYEHCSLFTAHSLAVALEVAGFGNARVSHVFGGQYLWAEARAGDTATHEAAETGIETPWMDTGRADYVGRWRAELEQAVKDGPVALWGAATKGVTFALLVDPQSDCIDHIVDINPAKQGKHVAMTGLPVLSPEASAERRPRTIFVMNPNYLREVAERVAALGLDARLVPIN
jgi:SAM-dependent methyltransferase